MPTPTDNPGTDLPEVRAFVADLLSRQFRRYRKRLKICQADFSEAAVHDLRVSIRRLLAIVDLLEAIFPSRQVKPARRWLKHQLEAFGELRDTQVQLLRLASLPRTVRAVSRFRRFLRQRERRCIRLTRKAVKRMRPGRLADWIAQGEEALRPSRKRPVRANQNDFTALVRHANETFARVQELRAAVDSADAGTIHRTRVAFKKYRYMAEALAPWWPVAARPRRQALRIYQDLMGAVQDATVLRSRAGKFARKKLDAEGRREFQAALEREQRRRINRYLRAADKLDDLGPLPLIPLAKPTDPARP